MCVIPFFPMMVLFFVCVFGVSRCFSKGRRRTGGSLQHRGGTAPGLRSALRKGLAGGIKGYDGLWMFLFFVENTHMSIYYIRFIYEYIYIYIYEFILYICVCMYLYIYIYVCTI